MSRTRIFLLTVLALCCVTCRASLPALSAQEVYQRAAASAVLVATPTGGGSGTVILAHPRATLVLTAHHVIADAPRRVRVLVLRAGDDGVERKAVRARVVAADKAHDLALLATGPGLGVPALPLATEEPALYEALYTIAAPLGLEGTVAPGVLTAKHRSSASIAGALWQLTGLVFFGSSGGTVTNDRAELVGVPVVVSTWSGIPIPQIGLCVPLETIRAFLDSAADEVDL